VDREQQDRERDQHQRVDGTMRAWVRDGLAIIFRHRRLVAATMAALLLTTAVAAYLQPARYEAQVKLLLRRDRVNSPVTPARELVATSTTSISEEELRSEVQILTSRDLLAQVARECRIEATQIYPGLAALLRRQPTTRTADARLDAAVRHLERWLDVQLVRNSYVLTASYEDPDPARARCVLDTLSGGYLQKHLTLQRPAGAFAFFQEEANGYRTELSRLQSQLGKFHREAGVASMELEKELAVRRLREGQAALNDTRAQVAEVTERIATLQASLGFVPARRTTQVRTADNAQLMEQLQSTLLALEQKRTELLTKYQPGYRLVAEVDQQIEQARASIAAATVSPLRDETTDADPTHEWVRTELTRAEVELAALQARERATARAVRTYQAEASTLADQSLEYEAIVRQIKAEEESYLLYVRKQEEARISEALDRQHISNVVITEPVNVSATPVPRRPLVLLIGVVFSLLGGILLAVIVDAWDPTFRTPDELTSLLGVPVLATLSKAPRAAGR
jgi:uncharacterized protein involved in exopolysaccharide biosynthesis